ncbi:polysaccharide biosynthesis/export family protein [Brevundimonas variabilis]|uniref:Polysaccharide export outer membrane protein n=1 Tax=Brevundimonas variabilis TaxID=74312 RepID=A0A7W9FFM0_9CAUL|nr:polysaccharide biosynthesis/export family protein [Brevundimonas variabilis]MBB5747490.1 polysaccharide export outer membrane protein [Brevundimonas variabilis]
MMLDRRHLLLTFGAAALAGCGAIPRPEPIVGDAAFTDIGFADWTDAEPEYLLYPGDEIEVALPTAAELTRTIRVGPDGRIALPLIGQVMAADRTLMELSQVVSDAYVGKLVRPVVEVSVRTAGPINIWVDGEVRTPGVYVMAGDISAYQAVVQAGGLLPSAKAQSAALIRRGPGGSRMLKVIDVRAIRGRTDALRRGDIVFVPRSTLGELAAFFTQFKAALPIGFSYSINGANGSGFANF